MIPTKTTATSRRAETAAISDQKRELVGQVIAGVGKDLSIITIFTPMEGIKTDVLDREGFYFPGIEQVGFK